MIIRHRLKISPLTKKSELKDEWIAYLLQLGYTNVKESDKYSYYDVEAYDPVYKKRILFELKNRTSIKPLLST